jgi:hypothetical protein
LEGTERKLKYSLLKFWKERQLPDLQAMAQRAELETGKRVVIRYQWDNATPHIDGKLKEFLQTQVEDRFRWMIKEQPSNSPLTNVQDAYLFPAMAKKVTEDQGLTNRSRILQGEALWEAMERVFVQYPPETLARSFCHHQQIAYAIFQCKASDQFVRDSKSLHCGVRKLVHPLYEQEGQLKPSGVEMIVGLEPVENRNLKFPKPDVSLCNPADYLSLDELDGIVANLEVQSDGFERFASALAEKQMREAQEPKGPTNRPTTKKEKGGPANKPPKENLGEPKVLVHC